MRFSLEVKNMPNKLSSVQSQDLINKYIAGRNTVELSREFNISSSTVRCYLIRGGEEIRGHMGGGNPKWVSPNLNAIVKRYISGESINELSKELKISRSTLRKRFDEVGIQRRNVDEAQIVYVRHNPHAAKLRSAKGGHGNFGIKRTEHELAKSALTKERKGSLDSFHEVNLYKFLIERGYKPIPQKAIGRYNVDLSVSSWAIEIFGTQHYQIIRSGESAFYAHRFKYILDLGWNLFCIWLYPRHQGISIAASNYLISELNLTKDLPASRGEYRMIWCDGNLISSDSLDLNNLTLVLPSRHGFRSNATNIG